MADRVSVAIRIGGTLPSNLLPMLEAAIAADDASTDWEGAPFVASDIPSDGPLYLVANEVAWGRFEEIECFCLVHKLAFARWSGGCSGSFPAERVVSDGVAPLRYFLVSDDDEVLISHETFRGLGSLEAIEQHFAAAELVIPPLVLSPTADPCGAPR